MADTEDSGLIPFGELMPDMGNYEAGGAIVVSNCVPYGQKYKPFQSLIEISSALGDTCKGAFSYRDAAGNVTIFAGTKAGLFTISAAGITNVTRLSGVYTGGDDNFWRFVPFGNLIICTNYSDDVQSFDITSSMNFAQMSSTAPKCRDLAVISNFLVCIDTVDGDGAIGYRVRWSPIADPQGVWGSIAATQTDFQDIYDTVYSNSYITDFGEYGVIMQGGSMQRMDYVGGSDIFTFNKIEKGQGTLLTRGNIYNGKSIFSRCEDGFYEWDGVQMHPIGDQKIDSYYLDNVDNSHDFNINCAIDPVRKLVMWAVPHTDSVGGICNKIYIYNWAVKRWSVIDQVTECLFSYITLGYTLEGLDAVSSTLEALPYSLDSRAWTAGKTVLAAFSSAHKLALFTGAAMTATIQTGEIRINQSGRSVVSSLTPYVEGGSVTGRLGWRNGLNNDTNWSTQISQNPYTGDLDFTVDSTFFRGELTISGNWTIAHGLAFDYQPTSDA